MDKSSKKLLGTTWLAGNASCTLIIPKPLAKEYGIDHPSNVVIEGRPEGILIRKMKYDVNVKRKRWIPTLHYLLLLIKIPEGSG
jgi:hypothetical protein